MIKDEKHIHPKQNLRVETIIPGNGGEKIEVGEWCE